CPPLSLEGFAIILFARNSCRTVANGWPSVRNSWVRALELSRAPASLRCVLRPTSLGTASGLEIWVPKLRTKVCRLLLHLHKGYPCKSAELRKQVHQLFIHAVQRSDNGQGEALAQQVRRRSADGKEEMFAMAARPKPLSRALDVSERKRPFVGGMVVGGKPAQGPKQRVVIHRLLENGFATGLEHPRDLGKSSNQI